MNELIHSALCERIQQLKDQREVDIQTALRMGLATADLDSITDSYSDLICGLYAQCDVINGCS